MADQVVLNADPRPGDGKGEARALRRAGRVPAVAYGAGLDAATAVHVDAADLRHALATDAGENVVIQMDIAGDTHLTMPREIHRHPVRRDVLHVDFVAIDKNVKVTVEIPLHVEGEVEGAVVNQVMNYLTVDVLPLEVPEYFTTTVEGREVGDVVRAGEVELPEGVDLLDDPERTAVTINLPDTSPVEDEDEAAEGEAAEGEAAEAAEGGEE
ncbi:50S ribosomal protein L25 [Euzebya rosea]|uniref:50S ribosomal protein L25 n=1 Tax=Euzebya rosea TaxID=2052804 RepID=UPI000D3E1EF0|nr:50S ribosomal protein L25 [Euzebya rosea]